MSDPVRIGQAVAFLDETGTPRTGRVTSHPYEVPADTPAACAVRFIGQTVVDVHDVTADPCPALGTWIVPTRYAEVLS